MDTYYSSTMRTNVRRNLGANFSVNEAPRQTIVTSKMETYYSPSITRSVIADFLNHEVHRSPRLSTSLSSNTGTYNSPPIRRNKVADFSTHQVYGPPRQAITSSSNKGQVIEFHSSAKWKIYFEAKKQTSKLIVIDFTASWCKPCKIIQPAFNEFAEKYTDVEFIKIDVDELSDVAAGFEVHVMPTFVLIKRGREVDKVVGVKKDELQKKIEKHRF